MNFLVAAYIAVWVILFVYMFSIASRQGKLKKEVEALLKELKA